MPLYYEAGVVLEADANTNANMDADANVFTYVDTNFDTNADTDVDSDADTDAELNNCTVHEHLISIEFMEILLLNPSLHIL